MKKPVIRLEDASEEIEKLKQQAEEQTERAERWREDGA